MSIAPIAIPTVLHLPSGLTLHDPLRRIMRFCKEEHAYYDAIPDADPNRVLPIDVLATISMNSFVNNAKKVRDVHRGIASRCDPLLPLIPADADILDFDQGLRLFERLIDAAVRAPGVLIPVATKVLHRKRRGLIPMLDNVVMKSYLEILGRQAWLDTKAQDGRTAAPVAVEVLRAFRSDLGAVAAEIDAIRRTLAASEWDMTPVRILEVLVWDEVQGYYRVRD